MSGTKIGAAKARDKILANNPNYYSELGAIGGKLGEKTYLRDNPEKARVIGQKGGSVSKRGHKFIKETSFYRFYTKVDTGETVKYKKGKKHVKVI